jgi:hypothetical protein
MMTWMSSGGKVGQPSADSVSSESKSTAVLSVPKPKQADGTTPSPSDVPSMISVATNDSYGPYRLFFSQSIRTAAE